MNMPLHEAAQNLWWFVVVVVVGVGAVIWYDIRKENKQERKYK